MIHVIGERDFRREDGLYRSPAEGGSSSGRDGITKVTCLVGKHSDPCGITGCGSTYQEALKDLWKNHPIQTMIE